jgi:hypothetical protein
MGIWGRIRGRGGVRKYGTGVLYSGQEGSVTIQVSAFFASGIVQKLDSFHYVQADSSPEGCNHICTASCVHAFTIYIQSCSHTYVTF